MAKRQRLWWNKFSQSKRIKKAVHVKNKADKMTPTTLTRAIQKAK
jgi:hypothetical protein